MKITHNKIGQNINISSDTKADKASASKDIKTNIAAKDLTKGTALDNNDGATKVEVSSRAQEAKRIKELATAAPDVDMEKVEKFRKLIDEGKYKVDAKAIAERMVDDELSINASME